jgi:hypothetical protein
MGGLDPLLTILEIRQLLSRVLLLLAERMPAN